MNKIYIPSINSERFQGRKPNKDLISQVTYFFTVLFIFLVPWGDGLWDGTPRIAATISLGMAAILFLTRGTKKNYTIAHLFIVSYFAWQLITLVWSPDQTYGIQVAITAIQLLLLVFLVTLVIDSKKKLHHTYQAYVFGNVVGSFIIIYNYINGIMSLYYGRYGIVNIETDTLSIILAFSIPMAAYLAAKESSKTLNIINLIAIPVILYAIFLTGSRTGVIVSVLGVLYWIFTYRKSSFFIKIIISIVMLGSITTIIAFAPKSLTERILSSGQSINSGTLNGRTEIWRGSLKHWKKAPFLGVGLGGLGYVLSKEHLNYRQAHNTFLHILTVNGLIGLLFYLLIIFTLFYHIAHTPLDEKAFLITLLFCILVSQIASHSQEEKFLWIFFSLIITHAKMFNFRLGKH